MTLVFLYFLHFLSNSLLFFPFLSYFSACYTLPFARYSRKSTFYFTTFWFRRDNAPDDVRLVHGPALLSLIRGHIAVAVVWFALISGVALIKSTVTHRGLDMSDRAGDIKLFAKDVQYEAFLRTKTCLP
jgi:hypothetical protein